MREVSLRDARPLAVPVRPLPSGREPGLAVVTAAAKTLRLEPDDLGMTLVDRDAAKATE